jgi:hypothetical protein
VSSKVGLLSTVPQNSFRKGVFSKIREWLSGNGSQQPRQEVGEVAPGTLGVETIPAPRPRRPGVEEILLSRFEAALSQPESVSRYEELIGILGEIESWQSRLERVGLRDAAIYDTSLGALYRMRESTPPERRGLFDNQIAFVENSLPSLVRANLDDYRRWVSTHIAAGGSFSQSYDSNWPKHSFYYAVDDLSLPPLHGPAAVNIIVPPGIKVECADPGHSNIYYMETGIIVGAGWVPEYSNLKLPCD